MPHNLAHLLYELRRKAGHNDFLSEEAITVIRQVAKSVDVSIATQLQVRGEGHTAAQFTETNDEELTAPDTADLDSGVDNFTIVLWLNFDSLISESILTKYSSGQEEIRLFYSTSTNTIRFGITHTTGENIKNAAVGSSTGVWVMVLIEAGRDLASGFNRGYNIELDNVVNSPSGTAGLPVSGTAQLSLGGRESGVALNSFDGKMNRVGWWHRLLTTADKAELYNNGTGRTQAELSDALKVDLKAYWNMYEASGQRNDSVGTNHLTDVNTVTQFQDGPLYYIEQADLRRNYCLNPSFEHDLTGWVQSDNADGNAAQFVLANTEYLSTASLVSLQTGDIDFAISGWFYLDTKAVDMTLISKWLTTGDHREYRLFFDQSEDRFRFEVSATGSSTVVNMDADNLGSPSVATWYYIECWHDKDADTINIQVNDGTVDSVAFTTGLSRKDGAFEIGSEDGGSNPFDGRITAVGFWKRVKTTVEKTFLYNSGIGKPYQGLDLLDDGSQLLESLIGYWNLDEESGNRADSHGSHILTDNNTVLDAAGLDSHVVNSRDDAQSNHGLVALKLEKITSPSAIQVISRAFTIIGLASGEVWSISSDVRVAALITAKFTLRLEFLDSSDVVQATHNVDFSTVSTSWATVINENRTAPATTTKLRATLILQVTGTFATGLVHCDGVLIEKVAAVGTYFDGDSQDCFWEVTMHNGESINDVKGSAAIAGFFKASA